MKDDKNEGCFCQKCGNKKILYNLFKSTYCIFCMKKTASQFRMLCETGHYELTFNRTKLTHKRPGTKRFLSQVIVGWMPSINKKKHPKGVFVSRFIDRENNLYKEEIVDRKTGKITESKNETLSEHYHKK